MLNVSDRETTPRRTGMLKQKNNLATILAAVLLVLGALGLIAFIVSSLF